MTSYSSEVRNDLIASFTAELRFGALSFDPRKINKKDATIGTGKYIFPHITDFSLYIQF